MESRMKVLRVMIIIWVIVLIVGGLLATPASAQTAEACDFSSAHHMLIDNFRSGQDYQHATTDDPDIMLAPQQWEGDSFWQGYDSPDPLDGFLFLTPLYTAIYYEQVDDEREEMIATVMVAQTDDEATVRALLIDPEGFADGAHGCAALILPREVADEWFLSAFGEMAAVTTDGYSQP